MDVTTRDCNSISIRTKPKYQNEIDLVVSRIYFISVGGISVSVGDISFSIGCISMLYNMQVMAFEMRLELMGQGASSYSTSSANSAQRGRGGFSRGQGGGRGTPCRGGGGRGQNSSPSRGGGQQFRHNNNTEGRPLCQVCFKPGHMANRCWHRFDESYEPDPRHLTAAAMNSYNIDTNW
jgi:hypothetical protein